MIFVETSKIQRPQGAAHRNLDIFRCAAPAFVISIYLSTNIKGALHQQQTVQGNFISYFLFLISSVVSPRTQDHSNLIQLTRYLNILIIPPITSHSDRCSAPMIFVETSKIQRPQGAAHRNLDIFRCAAPAFVISIYLSTNIKGALHQQQTVQGNFISYFLFLISSVVSPRTQDHSNLIQLTRYLNILIIPPITSHSDRCSALMIFVETSKIQRPQGAAHRNLDIFRCAAPGFTISIYLSTNIKGALHQ